MESRPCILPFSKPSGTPSSSVPPTSEYGDGLRLSQVWREHYRPLVLAPSLPSARTITAYTETLAHWQAATGDPPIWAISPAAIARFQAYLAALPGRKGPHLARHTQRRHLQLIDRLLRWCGTSGAADRGGAVWLGTPPRVRWPRTGGDSCERAFSIEEFFKLIEAVPRAHFPHWKFARQWEGWSWPEVFRAMLITAYLDGLRLGTLLAIEFSHLHAEDGATVLRAPAECWKRREARAIPLHPASVAAIEAIREPERKKIFGVAGYGGPWRIMNAERHLRWVSAAAGVEQVCYRSWHGIRKLHGTESFRRDHAAAQLTLGHRDARTTRAYVGAAADLEAILQVKSQLPLPELSPLDSARQLRLF